MLLVFWFRQGYQHILDRIKRFDQYGRSSVLIETKSCIGQYQFLARQGYQHILREAVKKVPPLVVRPLRPSPPPFSSLMVIGTF